MLKTIITFIFLFATLFVCYSQSISVSSFKLLDSDLTAITSGTMEQDQNGVTAALIKVVTSQTGFSFDGGAMGVVKTKQTPGEVWVYIPRGSKKLTIKHPLLGVLRDYYYPVSIEAGRTYEMVLTTGMVQTIVKQVSNSQYLVLKVTPSDAVVELDNELLPTTNGIAQKFVKLGTYEYRVQAANYHTSAGKVVVDDPNNKKVVEINLLPAYGWIELLGNEDSDGAQVFIDNTLVGTIPMKSQNLSSGEHNIRIVKPLYNPYSQTIKVNDNETTQITPRLSADFSVVTITVDNDADIYVNEEKKGTGSWTGKLGTGTYVIEAKKEGHRSTLTNVDILAEQKALSIQLPAPTPMYGSLNITSTPSEADIYIDGKNVGQTPLLITNVLSGPHNIKLSHIGYNDYTSIKTISEHETTSFNVVLSDENLIKVELKCNVPYATLFIDGKEYGQISDDIRLEAGSHRIKLIAAGYEDYEGEIYVSENSVIFNRHHFQMQPFKVLFVSDQHDTRISVDNSEFEYLGNSQELELSIGTHIIRVCYKGNNEFSENVEIVTGDESFAISFRDKKIFNSDINETEFNKINNKIEQEKEKAKNRARKEYESEKWKNVQVTSNPSNVNGMTFIGDITAKYGVGFIDSVHEKYYKKTIDRLKKKAAKLGAKKILLGQQYIGGLLNSFYIVPAKAYK